MENKDIPGLSRCGHDLMGMTSNFGFKALSEIARSMNQHARENVPVAALQSVVKQLRPAYKDTRRVVDEWLKK